MNMVTNNRDSGLEEYLSEFVFEQLEDMDFETLMEEFDVTLDQIFINAYYGGFIDPEIIKNLKKSG